MRQRSVRQRKDPYTKDRREPLEILAVLAGRTTYTVPTVGRSTSAPGLTPIDIAHAIAACKDRDGVHNKIGAHMALAIACQRETEFHAVHELAYPSLLRELQLQRAYPGVVSGPKKFRIRIVLWDAFVDTIKPYPRRQLTALAKEAKMEERAYRFLHRHISSFLEAQANSAASDAATYLFAPFAELLSKPGDHAVVMGSATGTITIFKANSPASLAAKLKRSVDIDSEEEGRRVNALIDEMLTPGARQRTLGVLSLAAQERIVVYVQV